MLARVSDKLCMRKKGNVNYSESIGAMKISLWHDLGCIQSHLKFIDSRYIETNASVPNKLLR